ncbi:MAG: hypothetical protein ACKOGJ_11145, partial [Phycisphaerales bacterium]
IPESIQWYGKAYEAVRPYLDAKAEATVSEAVVTTAVNQTMRIYRATPPERIMLCTLQGANYLWLGDVANARIGWFTAVVTTASLTVASALVSR